MDANEDLEKRNKKYEVLKKFYNKDLKLKLALLNIVPNQYDEYNEETRIKYIDKLEDNLKYFKSEFLEIARDFEFGNYTCESIKKYFEKANSALATYEYTRANVHDIYMGIFSGMREQFIEEVQDRCRGGNAFDDGLMLINKTQTIDELLHLMHSYITNNEDIMHSMPILAQNSEMFLYGEENETSRKIFDNFPPDLIQGRIDIVSMDNKIVMMARNIGHALSIDIDLTAKERDFIRYFIPKVCNKEMVKDLPGVPKVRKSSGIFDTATGMFEVSKEELTEKLYDFISKVPTDRDIPSVKAILEHSENNFESNDNEVYFSEQDAKEVAMTYGEKGTKKSDVQKIGKGFKNAIKNLKDRFIAKDNKEGGNSEYDRND